MTATQRVEKTVAAVVLLSPQRSLVSGAGEQIIGDDAAFIAVADPV
jgi:hypothetical protein